MTNFVAALAQSEAAMEIFREQDAGHFVMISSMSAMRGMPKTMTTYAATKAGVAHIAEGLRNELYGKPIKVTVLYPGYIASEMNERVDPKKAKGMVSTEKGVRAMVDAIEKEKDSACVPPLPWAPMSVLMKHAPLRVLKKISGPEVLADRRDRQRPPGLEGEGRAGADPGDGHLAGLLGRLVTDDDLDRPGRPGDDHVEVGVDGAHDRLERPDLGRADQRDPGTVVVRGGVRGRDVGIRVEQRVQRQHALGALDRRRQRERRGESRGGHPGDAGQLLHADLAGLLGSGSGRDTARRKPRKSRCICRHTSSAIRTSAECENSAKSRSASSGPE